MKQSDGPIDVFRMSHGMWQSIGCAIAFAVALSLIAPQHIGAGHANAASQSHWVVTYGVKPSHITHSAAERAGAVVKQSLGGNSFLMAFPPEDQARVASVPSVVSVRPYLHDDKVSDALKEARGVVGMRVLLHTGVHVSRALPDLMKTGLSQIRGVTDGSRVVRGIADTSCIEAIASLGCIYRVEEDPAPSQAMDIITSNPYIGNDAGQSAGFSGNGILAEIQDNGIDLSHPDLSRIVFTDGAVIADNHGTCTSGIVFGTGSGEIAAQGVLHEGTGAFCDWGTGREASVANLWNGSFNEGSAGMNGVLQSNSWYQGVLDGEYDSFSYEDDTAACNYPHVLSVWASGNSLSGTGPGNLSSDCVAKNVLGVGGVTHKDTANLSDDEWILSLPGETPSRGPAADGRQKPDLCGPFDNIHTVDAVGANGYTPGDYILSFGGTSGATPVVAAAAGQAYQMYAENHFGNNPLGQWPRSCTVKALLIADAYQYPLATADRDMQGWGTPDIEQMVAFGQARHWITEYPKALDAGESWTKTAYVDGTTPLKVTLCWMDPAASPATLSDRALLNNLDIVVTSPNGTRYYGNCGLYTSLWSTHGAGANAWSLNASFADDLNNVENVFVQDPEPGVWAFNVSGRDGDLVMGPQNFSLVASGACQETNPPSFSGISDITDPGNGYSLDLHWTAAVDAEGSYPIVYSIYRSTTGGTQNFVTPLATYIPSVNPGMPVTYRDNGPLQLGVHYYYVVRASDANGNGENNNVELSHAPFDFTPPSFDGVKSAEMGPAGLSIELAWDAATDISQPITYLIYRSTLAGGENFYMPIASTQYANYSDYNISLGVPYFYVVRAMDSLGYEDCNNVEMNASSGRLFFQVEGPIIGWKNLNGDSLLTTIQETEIMPIAPGLYRLDNWNTGWLSPHFSTPRLMDGKWKFSVYGKMNNGNTHGYLFAEVRDFNNDGLFFQTVNDDEDIGTYIGGYHEFYWEHDVQNLVLPAGKVFYVQLWLNVTSAIAPQTTYDYSIGAQVDRLAYTCLSTDAPATTGTQTELSASEYPLIVNMDGARYGTPDAGRDDYVSMRFEMNISSPPSVINSVRMTFYGQVGRTITGNELNLYAWNATASNWTFVGGGEVSTNVDTLLRATLSGVRWSDYVVGPGNRFVWLAQFMDRVFANPKKTKIYTDTAFIDVNISQTIFTMGYDSTAAPSCVYPTLTMPLPPYPWFNISVGLGWNLISVPLLTSGISLPGALMDREDGGGGYVEWDRLQYYDPQSRTNPWKQYCTEWNPMLNDLVYVNHTMGIWINVTSVGDGQICIGGYGYSNCTTTVIRMSAGWNLVGYPVRDDSSHTVADLMQATGATLIEGYDASSEYRITLLQPTAVMERGHAYWVYCPSATYWSLNW